MVKVERFLASSEVEKRRSTRSDQANDDRRVIPDIKPWKALSELRQSNAMNPQSWRLPAVLGMGANHFAPGLLLCWVNFPVMFYTAQPVFYPYYKFDFYPKTQLESYPKTP
ncbi:hypothetical protein B0H11DRAFT_1910805 [Mycena galericulata]|nr:hypothetical protein B0H11DRAFT_1910805 [Mycena galericulata]